MKIAILASGAGEKATYLHDFFKEGNRIEIDCLLTDNPYAPIVERMKQEGIEVVQLLPEQSWAELAGRLKGRDVELIVVDDFSGDVPPALAEAFGDAIVFPGLKERAPIEVIEAVDRINSPAATVVKDIPRPKDGTPEGEETEMPEYEREWAEALNINPPKKEEPGEEPANEPVYEPVREDERLREEPRHRNANFEDNSKFEEREPMPPTYLVWSVIIAILCCLVPGIIAIIYSSLVSSKYYAGNIEGAKRASRNAQIWCIVSIIAGIVWATLYMPLMLFLGS